MWYNVRIFVIVIVDICYVPKLPDNSREKLSVTTSAMLLGKSELLFFVAVLKVEFIVDLFLLFLVRLVFPGPV